MTIKKEDLELIVSERGGRGSAAPGPGLAPRQGDPGGAWGAHAGVPQAGGALPGPGPWPFGARCSGRCCSCR